MKIKTKILAVLLTISIIFAGCSNNSSSKVTVKSDPSKPYAGYNIVLCSFAGWLNPDLEKAVSAKLKADTGMTVSYIIIPWADRFTKMATMISAGQQIDVTGKSTPGDMSILCDSGALLPLDSYLKDSKTFSSDNWDGTQYMDKMKYNGDGKYYGIPTLKPMGYNWFINKAWLDKLNLQIPTTLDQLNIVLSKFKDAQLGGVATVPIAHQFPNEDHIATFLGMWGIEGPWIMKKSNGDIYHPWLTQNGLAGLQWMQNMYAKGILDPSFATENGTTIVDKVKSGKVGIFMDFAGGNLPVNEVAKANGALCNMVPMQIPKAISNITPVNCGNSIIMDNIVSTSKNPKAAWAFIEWLNSPNGIRAWTWTKGVNYSINTDGSTKLITTQLHSGGFSDSNTLSKAFLKADDIYKAPKETIDANNIFFKNWAMPAIIKNSGEANDIALPLATRVICNQMSVSEFEKTLKSQLAAKGFISK